MPSLRPCSVGPPPSAIPGRGRLTRHPCRVAHCARPAFSLWLTGQCRSKARSTARSTARSASRPNGGRAPSPQRAEQVKSGRGGLVADLGFGCTHLPCGSEPAPGGVPTKAPSLLANFSKTPKIPVGAWLASDEAIPGARNLSPDSPFSRAGSLPQWDGCESGNNWLAVRPPSLASQLPQCPRISTELRTPIRSRVSSPRF